MEDDGRDMTGQFPAADNALDSDNIQFLMEANRQLQAKDAALDKKVQEVTDNLNMMQRQIGEAQDRNESKLQKNARLEDLLARRKASNDKQRARLEDLDAQLAALKQESEELDKKMLEATDPLSKITALTFAACGMKPPKRVRVKTPAEQVVAEEAADATVDVVQGKKEQFTPAAMTPMKGMATSTPIQPEIVEPSFGISFDEDNDCFRIAQEPSAPPMM